MLISTYLCILRGHALSVLCAWLLVVRLKHEGLVHFIANEREPAPSLQQAKGGCARSCQKKKRHLSAFLISRSIVWRDLHT